MKIPLELATDIFYDEDAETVALCVDRVSLMLDKKEFFDLALRVNIAVEKMLSSKEDEESEEAVSGNVIPFTPPPSDEEFH
tara:strand:- start:429 stop:671 length:243 start_codon:yes stop_codon:yes gene_type:complete